MTEAAWRRTGRNWMTKRDLPSFDNRPNTKGPERRSSRPGKKATPSLQRPSRVRRCTGAGVGTAGTGLTTAHLCLYAGASRADPYASCCRPSCLDVVKTWSPRRWQQSSDTLRRPMRVTPAPCFNQHEMAAYFCLRLFVVSICGQQMIMRIRCRQRLSVLALYANNG
ncbi:hypothetical protein LZ30DRAFT_702877 [Colletotrichum cereale]|nr:hypothetical protein LZ30DRAFT_702877 [Colletotrichum cereale]